MIIDQVSVFVENKPGTLADITALLAEAEIDIKTFTIADTSGFGVLRLIVDSPKKAVALLKMNGWVVMLTPVLAAKMTDEPGSLAKILKKLSDKDINVEYMYAFVAKEEKTAYVILRVQEQEKAIEMLREMGIEPADSIIKV